MYDRLKKLLEQYVLESGQRMGLIGLKPDAIVIESYEDLILPVADDLKKSLVEMLLLSSDAHSPGSMILLNVSLQCLELGAMFLDLAENKGISVIVEIDNLKDKAILFNYADKNLLSKLVESSLENYQSVNKVVKLLVNEDPHLISQIDQDKWEFVRALKKPIKDRILSGDLFYTLTALPTPTDAEADEVNYHEYLQLFFEACVQPWGAIDDAQKKLVNCFNQAKTLRITNDDGTDIKMSLEGQTFVNSVIAKNIPGAEIFSSPLRDSVNGIVVAKGKFQEGRSGIMEDLTLVFEQGRLVKAFAEVGNADLQELITADDGNGEGMRYIGEIGFGNNPRLRKHLINGLLVEKIAGSFHVALGSAYQYDEYCGQKVKVDNGNRSTNGMHWDITTMLAGKNGKIYLDDQLIQDNGLWLIQGVDVLNTR